MKEEQKAAMTKARDAYEDAVQKQAADEADRLEDMKHPRAPHYLCTMHRIRALFPDKEDHTTSFKLVSGTV